MRALMDDTYDVSGTYTREQLGKDYGYGAEGEAAADRVEAITNPYATGAMWDEEWMRQEQDRYMQDLRERAMGIRSVAREQAEQTQGRMSDLMSTASRTGVSRFDQGSMAQDLMRERSMLPGALWAQTEAQARQEQAQAQQALQQYLSQRQAQDTAAMSAWMNLQNIENQQKINAAKTKFMYEPLTSEAQRWHAEGGVSEQKIKSDW